MVENVNERSVQLAALGEACEKTDWQVHPRSAQQARRARKQSLINSFNSNPKASKANTN